MTRHVFRCRSCHVLKWIEERTEWAAHHRLLRLAIGPWVRDDKGLRCHACALKDAPQGEK